MGWDKKGQRYCDECGRAITKAHRRHEDLDFCSSCYPRVFIQAVCRTCGGLARFHRHQPETERKCAECVRKDRRCLRCEKSLPVAAKLVDGGAVCGSCAPHFREPKPCAWCGCKSRRLSRARHKGVDERICGRCLGRLTHKTCSVCHRYRPVAGVLDDGRPYCDACIPERPKSHPCPVCRTVIPGDGYGRCTVCLNADRVERHTSMQAMALRNEWARAEYRAFGLWLLAEKPEHRALTKLLARHFPFFERLDVNLGRVGDLDSDRLLDLFEVSGLRSHLLPMRFLATRHGIEVDEAAKVEHVERQRIAGILKRAQGEPCGELLVEYDRWLADRGTKSRTARLYISAAARFCLEQSVGPDGNFTPEALTRFLARAPGLRANLFRWLAFCREMRGVEVPMPPPKRLARTPRHVNELAALLRRIETMGAENAPRSLLDRALAKAFGYRLNQFAGRAWSVRHHATEMFLFDQRAELKVPRRLVPLAEALASANETNM